MIGSGVFVTVTLNILFEAFYSEEKNSTGFQRMDASML